MMRLDPQLSFLNICGVPSQEEEEQLAKPMNKNVDMDDQESNSKLDDDEDDSLMSGSKTPSERGAKISTDKTKDTTNNAKENKEKPADFKDETNSEYT